MAVADGARNSMEGVLRVYEGLLGTRRFLGSFLGIAIRVIYDEISKAAEAVTTLGSFG